MNPADYDASPRIQIDPSSFVMLRVALHPDQTHEVVDLRFRDRSIDEVADLIEPADDFDELFFVSRFVDEIDRLTRLVIPVRVRLTIGCLRLCQPAQPTCTLISLPAPGVAHPHRP